jgi:PAS domain S-box-containing protein
MLIVSPTGNIVLPNTSFCKILSLSKEELTGVPLSRLIYQEDSPGFITLFEDLISGNKKHLLMDCRFACKEKTLHWLHLSMTMIKNLPAAKPNVFGIVEDVTQMRQLHDDLKRSKESAEEAMKTKSDFLANVSHEIRTPIHTIIGMGELLSDTSLDAEQKEYASQIEFAADVLLSLVNNILDFSKIEAGRLNLELIDFDLSKMAEEAVDLVSLEAHRKGLEFVSWINPSVPRTIKGDPHRIRQIIVNLVKNAVKFTEKGDVLLTVRTVKRIRDRLAVRFAVQDTGIGISEDQKERLFDSFTQADSSTSRRFGGTGLGLTISKDLTRLMGGEIGVESKPAKGSTFWFVLPLEEAEENGRSAGGDTNELTGTNILIVDDNRTVQKVLSSYLKFWGCKSASVSNGSEALIMLREAAETPDKFDLVLIDSQMPGIDGWQLAGEISSDKTINYLKLVLLTPAGKSGDEAKMKLLHWFDDYLNKPVRLEQLRETLIRTTGQSIDLETVEADETPQVPDAELEVKKDIQILLAEDHVVNQVLFRTILEKMGYCIHVANDGKEAVDMAGKAAYDLIFMDIQMPNMNGLDATRAIRESDNEIPVIAVTASATKEEMQRCFDAGMNDFISKPFKKKDIAPILEKWLAERKKDSAKDPESDSSGNTSAAAGNSGTPDETESPIFNFTAAVETFLGNEKVVLDVLGSFSAKVEKDVGQLREAYERQDFDALNKAAHSIKGGALNLEVRRLGNAAHELEQAAKEKSIEETEISFKKVIRAYDELRMHIKEKYPSMSAPESNN